MDASFMSESIYEKLPSANSTPTRPKRHKTIRRKSMPILHEHFEPGSMIREIQAHNDTITALDFDVPFGTMVTSALDDTVRVWDMNAGRCIGLLEGHTASVRTLQVEDNIVATGSMDATIRLWDLSKARYDPQDNRINKALMKMRILSIWKSRRRRIRAAYGEHGRLSIVYFGGSRG
jgi:division protein 1